MARQTIYSADLPNLVLCIRGVLFWQQWWLALLAYQSKLRTGFQMEEDGLPNIVCMYLSLVVFTLLKAFRYCVWFKVPTLLVGTLLVLHRV